MILLCKHIKLTLAGFLLGTLLTDVCAQNRYSTDLLAQIATKTGLKARIDTLSEGLYDEWTVYKSLPVTVSISDSCVTHIGYSIFNSRQRQGFGSSICNFIERYCLELSIPVDPKFTTAQRQSIDGVSLSKGIITSTDLRTLCADTTLCINLQSTGSNYTIGWRRGTTWVQSISFPIEYDLLMGTDMDERERRLHEDLLRCNANTPIDTVPAINLLTKAWQDNYYTLQGGTYLLPSLSANQYFEKSANGKLKPIYSTVYPIESLANLFTSCRIDHDYMIDIRLHKYGFKTDTLSVPLKTWISYCVSTGCKPYFGIIKLDDVTAVCELIMHNENLGYNHIMKLEFPMSIFEQRKGRVTARLNSYVTSSRIKKLFDDNN